MVHHPEFNLSPDSIGAGNALSHTRARLPASFQGSCGLDFRSVSTEHSFDWVLCQTIGWTFCKDLSSREGDPNAKHY